MVIAGSLATIRQGHDFRAGLDEDRTYVEYGEKCVGDRQSKFVRSGEFVENTRMLSRNKRPATKLTILNSHVADIMALAECLLLSGPGVRSGFRLCKDCCCRQGLAATKQRELRPMAQMKSSKSKKRDVMVSSSPGREPDNSRASVAGASWTFLTNHTHVLILLARNPSIVLRAVAIQVGITERAVQRIIADLEEGGIIEREKVGRQNHYRIMPDQPLRHPVEAHRSIGDLLSLLSEEEE